MIILVDMDDTMEQLLAAWIRGVNERYGTDTAYEEILSWDVSAAFPGLTHDQVYAIPEEPGFWGTVDPMPGAAEALERLIAAGHEVYIVTAATHESLSEKMTDLLFRWFPFISWDHVIITSRKQMIRGDVLIDDGIHNLEGGSYAKILMTAPHNVHYDAESAGMIRVRNWDEIEEAVGKLEQDGVRPSAGSCGQQN